MAASGIPMSHTTVQIVTNIESQTEKWQKIFYVYEKRIAERFNEKYIDADYLQNNNDKPAFDLWEELTDDDRVFYE